MPAPEPEPDNEREARTKPKPLEPFRSRPEAPGVVVFAHVPPPHHGQSFAVALLLEQLSKDPGDPDRSLRVFHVDARLSDDIEAIGRFQPRKILRLLRYCLQAIRLRLKHRPRVLYYIPAAPMRSAIIRDWLVMALCRPFYRRVVFHWEAAGLAEWLRDGARPWERFLTHALLDRHTLSIVLAEHGRADGEAFRARRVVVVPNGLPDPCPDFETRLRPILAARRARLRERARTPGSPAPVLVAQALFLSLCIPEKGLFDAVEAVARVNGELATRKVALRLRLSVAGRFWKEEDQARFDARIAEADLRLPDGAVLPAAGAGDGAGEGAGPAAVVYRGFVAAAEKRALFECSDLFLFPSYYPAESFGLALAEAMAFGLPIVAARWRHIPEMFAPGHPFLVPPRAPEAIANAVLRLFDGEDAEDPRRRFEACYTDRAYGEGVRSALLSAARDAGR